MNDQTQGKGRPTPKRSEAQKRRGGPVAPPPTNRREAAKALRAKQAQDRQQLRRGTLAGDERHLTARDAGPVRGLVRDVVDARRNIGFLLLPVALLVVVAGLTGNVSLQAATFGVWLATLLGTAIDLLLLGFLLRSRLRAAFPQEGRVLGHVVYGLLRSTVIRRWRSPRPRVARGQRVG